MGPATGPTLVYQRGSLWSITKQTNCESIWERIHIRQELPLCIEWISCVSNLCRSAPCIKQTFVNGWESWSLFMPGWLHWNTRINENERILSISDHSAMFGSMLNVLYFYNLLVQGSVFGVCTRYHKTTGAATCIFSPLECPLIVRPPLGSSHISCGHTCGPPELECM